jgi:ATP-dependent Clp protease ATP-binding subunit ClpA
VVRLDFGRQGIRLTASQTRKRSFVLEKTLQTRVRAEKFGSPDELPERVYMAEELVDWENYDALAAEAERAKQSLDDKALAAILKKKVIGQDKVADQITKQLKRRIAQTQLSKGKVEKPLGVFCLAGPPGTGKTYFSKVLAENMYDGKGKLLHLDMTQYAQGHSKTSLIGSPQGYVGGTGSLTGGLEANPKYIVLLDEFEKAHAEVHKIFLTAWNDGFITDAHTGKKVSTTQALFMLTTNAAWEQLLEIEKSMKDDPAQRNRAVVETLRQNGFAPEVLSRIDHTFVFEPLDSRGLARVAALEIQGLAKRFSVKVVKIDPKYIFDMVSQERFQGIGIRDLARALEEQLSDHLLEAKQSGSDSVRIGYEDGQPMIEGADTIPPEAA